MNQFSKADLHIHTLHSDGVPSVTELLRYVAEQTDLRVIAITDHDTITGARHAARIAREFGISVVIGEEVTTAEGHLLALFIDSFLPPARPVAQTIATIHAQGGLAIAPHPFDRHTPSLGRCGLNRPDWRLDALEGFNASVLWPERGRNRMTQIAARELGLPLTGGSDAHTLWTVGQGYTLFPGHSADDLYRAIKSGAVTWGGSYWTLSQYFDMGRQIVRQHGVLGSLRLASAGVGLTAR